MKKMDWKLMLTITTVALAMSAGALAQETSQPKPSPDALASLGAEGAKSQDAAAPNDFSGQVTLEQFTSAALANNPAIKAAGHRVLAMRARVPQARALPDPRVEGGWMGRLRPFGTMPGDPSSYRSLSVTEEIPFPGKRGLRGQIAGRDAEAARWEYESTRREVVAEVKAAYYEWFYDRKAIGIARKDKDLLEKLEKIAEARYQVGKGIQQDALRAQVETSKLLQRLTVLDQQEKTARARLNALLDRDPEAPLGEPAPLTPSKLVYSLDELYQLARQNDPELERQARLIERSQLALNLAQKEYRPDFSVGYTYQQRPSLMDMHGFMVGVNIPIFYKSKQREGVIEASEDLVSARRDREARATTASFAVKEQYLAAKAAEDLADLYSKAVVPQSSLALESAISSYEVGNADFLTLLDNFRAVLDYETDYYRELTDFQIALARLEPLVGVELTK